MRGRTHAGTGARGGAPRKPRSVRQRTRKPRGSRLKRRGPAERAESEAQAARQREEEQARERERLQEQLEQERRRQQAQEEQAAQERQQQAERAEAQAREARVRQEALARLTQLAARTEPLAAKADLTLKAGERALRDVRTALADLPPLPSKREHDEIAQRLKERPDRAHGESAGAAGADRLAAVGEPRRPGTALREDGGLASLEDPVEIAAPGPRAAGAVARGERRAAAAGRRVVAPLQGGARRRVGPLRGALCRGGRGPRRESRQEDRAVREGRGPCRVDPAGFKPPKKSSGCRSSGRRSAPSAAVRRRRFGSGSGAPAIASSRAGRRTSPNTRSAGPRTWPGRKRCARRSRRSPTRPTGTLAAAEIRRLQSEWKTIGPVKKSRSEAIWQRFRSACDRFFIRYAQRHEIARGERVAAREAICAELEALVACRPPESDPSALTGRRHRRQLPARRTPQDC